MSQAPLARGGERRPASRSAGRGICVAALDAALFARAAAVVRKRSDVLDGADGEIAGAGDGLDRGFAAAPRTLDLDLDFLDSEFGGPLGGDFRGALGGERRALAAAFKAARAGR